MKYTYRVGTIEDTGKLQKLGLSSYKQFQSVLTIENWNKMNLFLSTERSYLDLLSKSTCFVCETHEEIVGMIYLVPKGNPTPIFQEDWSYIRMFGVNPA